MPKDKKPRRKKTPREETNPAADEPIEPPTQSKGELVPPIRRPPTAVAADTVPPREPAPVRPHQPPSQQRPFLFRVLQTVRGAVGALMDLADATAEAITKQVGSKADGTAQ